MIRVGLFTSASFDSDVEFDVGLAEFLVVRGILLVRGIFRLHTKQGRDFTHHSNHCKM